MRKNLNYLIITGLLLFFANMGCKEQNLRQLKDKGDATPGQVSDVHVENRHGGAKITYKLPDSKSLLYVEAIYSPSPGITRKAKSTFYGDSIIVKGFHDASQYSVKLYSVSRGGSRSEPKIVKVNPLTPPYIQAFNSLKVNAIFGGISFSFINPSQTTLTFVVLTKDSLGLPQVLKKFYNEKKADTLSVIGLNAVKQEFQFVVRDQFKNESDTLTKELTPLFEVELDKSKFSNAKIPGDDWEPRFGKIENLWDGKIAEQTSYFQATLIRDAYITIDLGQYAILSRFDMCGRPKWSTYNQDYPKIFELWGSADSQPDSAFDDTWFKYGTFVSTPPSGQDPPIDSDHYPTLPGENFNIPNAIEHPAIRYLRIKVLRTYRNLGGMSMGEITLYGQPE